MENIDKNGIFRDWVNQYYQYGFRIAFRIMGNEEECRDIVQDAFLKVWIKFDEYKQSVKFSTWLFTIITNLCYDRLRKMKTAAHYTEAFEIKNEPGDESAEREINAIELRNMLTKLSGSLSPKQKIVFVLRDLEELEMEEICEIAGMDREQVKANLYYARKTIRKNLISLKIMEEKI
jgi:RNA polymerase sigma-70 factor, ECF subfamily